MLSLHFAQTQIIFQRTSLYARAACVYFLGRRIFVDYYFYDASPKLALGRTSPAASQDFPLNLGYSRRTRRAGSVMLLLLLSRRLCASQWERCSRTRSSLAEKSFPCRRRLACVCVCAFRESPLFVSFSMSAAGRPPRLKKRLYTLDFQRAFFFSFELQTRAGQVCRVVLDSIMLTLRGEILLRETFSCTRETCYCYGI